MLWQVFVLWDQMLWQAVVKSLWPVFVKSDQCYGRFSSSGTNGMAGFRQSRPGPMLGPVFVKSGFKALGLGFKV